MNWRFEKLSQVSSDFGFLNGADLVERDSNYLIKAAADLAIKYDNDLKPSDFTSEIINFKNVAIVKIVQMICGKYFIGPVYCKWLYKWLVLTLLCECA
ncbi:hypothetical protein QTP88_023002 [Uroleucon formosanum]